MICWHRAWWNDGMRQALGVPAGRRAANRRWRAVVSWMWTAHSQPTCRRGACRTEHRLRPPGGCAVVLLAALLSVKDGSCEAHAPTASRAPAQCAAHPRGRTRGKVVRQSGDSASAGVLWPASAVRVFNQLLNLRQHPFDQRRRCSGCVIDCDVVGNRVQISQCRHRPDYFSHRAMRCCACSWRSVRPCATAISPRAIPSRSAMRCCMHSSLATSTR